MGVAQYNGNQDIKTTRKYFTGTTKLRKGQVLAYDEAATKTNADPKLQLGSAVQALTSTNKNYLAGIVPDTEAGKQGPCFVEILQPQAGDVVDVEVEGTTAVSAGDILKADNSTGALIKDASPASGVPAFKSFEAQAVGSKVVIRVEKQ